MNAIVEVEGMIIRPAEMADFDGLIRLYRQLNADDPDVTDGRDRKAFEEILQSDRLVVFVGSVDDRLIATCYFNFIPNITRNVSPYAIIENVVTDSEFRNRGFGHAIIKHALQYAWDLGCYKVMLQTGSRRESTHQFYKSCGFSADDKFAFVARPG